MPDESAPQLDHPWALWAAFVGWKSWLFRRDIPPTLQHPRYTVRLMRMATLMGTLGLISTGVISMQMALEAALRASGATGVQGFGFMLLPGISFGLCVLVPLSRWQGRNWWLTIPAVPISAAIYFGAIMAFLGQYPIMSNEKNAGLAGLCAGLVGGGGLGLWMNPPLSWRALRVIGLTILVAIGCSWIMGIQFDHEPPTTAMMPEPIRNALAAVSMFGPFHVLVAMSLGMRLVDSSPTKN